MPYLGLIFFIILRCFRDIFYYVDEDNSSCRKDETGCLETANLLVTYNNSAISCIHRTYTGSIHDKTIFKWDTL